MLWLLQAGGGVGKETGREGGREREAGTGAGGETRKEGKTETDRNTLAQKEAEAIRTRQKGQRPISIK